MSARLEGRVALVTGAAQGIGRAIAERFAAEGATVAILDRSASIDSVFDQLRRQSGLVGCAIRADVSVAAEVEAAIDQITRAYGRLDVLANNAGVVQPMIELADTSDELFERVFAVNLRGVFNCSRAAARHMVRQKHGVIINMGSWFGVSGHAHFAVYCASKAAVINFTQSLALELAPHGVRVNCVSPGNVDTDMHWAAIRDEASRRGMSFEEMVALDTRSIPLGRVASPGDIAAAYAFLASSEAAYITGEALNVNGGVEFH